MKKFLFLLSFLLFAGLSWAQPGFTLKTLENKQDASVASASAHSAWLGSTLSAEISGDLKDNILVSAMAMYDIELGGGWWMPIISNVGIVEPGDVTSFVFGSSGLSIGAYPYKILSQSDRATFIVHGGASYKLQPNTGAEEAPYNTKLLAGFEYAFSATGDLPITASITPTYNITNTSLENLFGLEATFVLPVTSHMGLLVEAVAPFKKGLDPIFRIGFITSKRL